MSNNKSLLIFPPKKCFIRPNVATPVSTYRSVSFSQLTKQTNYPAYLSTMFTPNAAKLHADEGLCSYQTHFSICTSCINPCAELWRELLSKAD